MHWNALAPKAARPIAPRLGHHAGALGFAYHPSRCTCAAVALGFPAPVQLGWIGTCSQQLAPFAAAQSGCTHPSPG